MKKIVLILAVAIITINVMGQKSMPNGSFESWTAGSYDYPTGYPYNSNSEALNRYNTFVPNIKKTTDAYHGSSAIEVSTVLADNDTMFGYFINGNPNGEGPWTGGIPYNQKPTGIRGYYKYNQATIDSATILITFSKAGKNIGTYFYRIGGVQNSYKLFNFTFSPALNETPDSVIFGAVSCKIANTNSEPEGVLGSILKLDSVSFTGVSSQPTLFNGDFEQWQVATNYKLDNWYIEDTERSTRSTDAYKGSYALEMNTIAGEDNGVPEAKVSRISTGYYPRNCQNNCYELGGNAFNKQVDTLVFYYKYTPKNTADVALVIYTLKFNGSQIDRQEATIYPSSTYKKMEVPINAFQTPDTIIVGFHSSKESSGNLDVSYAGAKLIIDEVQFKSQPLNTSIYELNNNTNISVCPNPAKDFVSINSNLKVENYKVINHIGQVVDNGQLLNNNKIDISKLSNGVYQIQIISADKVLNSKFVKE